MSKKKYNKYKLLKFICREILKDIEPVWDEDIPKNMQEPTRFYLGYRLVNQLRSQFPVKKTN